MTTQLSTQPTRIYLDYNATAPMVPEAIAAAAAAFSVWGNPSSVHTEGRAARAIVEKARVAVAALFGADRFEVVFTSGGTEANQLGVLGLAAAARQAGLPAVVAYSDADHPALKGAAEYLLGQGWQRRPLPLDGNGALIEPNLVGSGLVLTSAVNHELGVLGPVARLAQQKGEALLFVDAVQAAGKVPLATICQHADAVSISGHKIGGGKGAGALWLRGGARTAEALPLVAAGHQERGRRPGTEAVPAVAGFGAAALRAAARLAEWPAVAALGDQLEQAIMAIEGARINGAGATRVGGTINASFAGALGESVVMALDLAGVAASTGAACTSGSIKPSQVLLAIGHDEIAARSAVRFSLGHATTADEIATVGRLLPGIVAQARR